MKVRFERRIINKASHADFDQRITILATSIRLLMITIALYVVHPLRRSNHKKRVQGLYDKGGSYSWPRDKRRKSKVRFLCDIVTSNSVKIFIKT